MNNIPQESINPRNIFFRHISSCQGIRNTLRNKCRERLKNNRQECIDILRNVSRKTVSQELLASMMRLDFRDFYRNKMAKENKSLDESESEIDTTEQENQPDDEWIIDAFDHMFNDETYLEEIFNSLDEVICPVCQKLNITSTRLEDGQNMITCKCGLRIKTLLEPDKIRELAMKAVEKHNNFCNENPNFSAVNEPEGNNLYLVCGPCNHMQIVI